MRSHLDITFKIAPFRHTPSPTGASLRCYKAPGGVRAQVRRSRQGPGRRCKGPEALSTPRGRDVASPGIVGSIPAEPRQSQHAMVHPLPTIYTPIKAILHFLTKSQENPLPQIESMHFSGHGEPFGHKFQNRTVSPYPVANRCEFEGAKKHFRFSGVPLAFRTALVLE